MKALVEADGDGILGFTMIGAEVVQYRNADGHAVHWPARRDNYARDNGRGARRALLECSGPIRLAQKAYTEGSGALRPEDVSVGSK